MKGMEGAVVSHARYSNHTWITTWNMFTWSRLMCLQIQTCQKEYKVLFYYKVDLANGCARLVSLKCLVLFYPENYSILFVRHFQVLAMND